MFTAILDVHSTTILSMTSLSSALKFTEKFLKQKFSILKLLNAFEPVVLPYYQVTDLSEGEEEVAVEAETSLVTESRSKMSKLVSEEVVKKLLGEEAIYRIEPFRLF